MNRIFLETLLEHKHLFSSLLQIDNQVMNASYQGEQIEFYIESLLLEDSLKSKISISSNSLVLSTGELFESLYFFAMVDTSVKFIFFPNYSFLGMNTLFVKIYNLIYGDCCILAKEKNYNRYLQVKDQFSSIYVLGNEIVYLEMKSDFQEAKWISI